MYLGTYLYIYVLKLTSLVIATRLELLIIYGIEELVMEAKYKFKKLIVSKEGLTLIEKSRVDVCNANSFQFGRMYEQYLELYTQSHSEPLFITYIEDYWDGDFCPLHGEVSYIDGQVQCSIHPRVDDDNVEEDADSGGGVPFF
ncbi:hypothetical protein J2S74_001839 [Evansella vedderi]|uniref:Uncharacterized protein n=1 Tax=Evansella vedderi TaxID=38282 RepID=A0ABT9ZT99_9BACI|nr:hypothetical protein [Evansella vedderi]